MSLRKNQTLARTQTFEKHRTEVPEEDPPKYLTYSKPLLTLIESHSILHTHPLNHLVAFFGRWWPVI